MEDHRYIYAEDKVVPSKRFSIGKYANELGRNGYILTDYSPLSCPRKISRTTLIRTIQPRSLYARRKSLEINARAILRGCRCSPHVMDACLKIQALKHRNITWEFAFVLSQLFFDAAKLAIFFSLVYWYIGIGKWIDEVVASFFYYLS